MDTKVEQQLLENSQNVIPTNDESNNNDETLEFSDKQMELLAAEKLKPLIEAVQNRELILLIGKTGVGKSTFTSYMLGNIMGRVASSGRSGKTRIDVLKQNYEGKNPEIGHAGKPKTLHANVYPVGNDRAYFDSPGFGGNRNLDEKETEILSTHWAIQKSQGIAVIFIVLNYEELKADDRLANFIKLMENLTDIIGDSIEKSPSSICFLINKIPEEELTEQGLEKIRTLLFDKFYEQCLITKSILDETQQKSRSREDIQANELKLKLLTSLIEYTKEDFDKDLQQYSHPESLDKEFIAQPKLNSNVILLNLFDQGQCRTIILDKIKTSSLIRRESFNFHKSDAKFLEFCRRVEKMVALGNTLFTNYLNTKAVLKFRDINHVSQQEIEKAFVQQQESFASTINVNQQTLEALESGLGVADKVLEEDCQRIHENREACAKSILEKNKTKNKLMAVGYELILLPTTVLVNVDVTEDIIIAQLITEKNIIRFRFVKDQKVQQIILAKEAPLPLLPFPEKEVLRIKRTTYHDIDPQYSNKEIINQITRLCGLVPFERVLIWSSTLTQEKRMPYVGRLSYTSRDFKYTGTDHFEEVEKILSPEIMQLETRDDVIKSKFNQQKEKIFTNHTIWLCPPNEKIEERSFMVMREHSDTVMFNERHLPWKHSERVIYLQDVGENLKIYFYKNSRVCSELLKQNNILKQLNFPQVGEERQELKFTRENNQVFLQVAQICKSTIKYHYFTQYASAFGEDGYAKIILWGNPLNKESIRDNVNDLDNLIKEEKIFDLELEQEFSKRQTQRELIKKKKEEITQIAQLDDTAKSARLKNLIEEVRRSLLNSTLQGVAELDAQNCAEGVKQLKVLEGQIQQYSKSFTFLAELNQIVPLVNDASFSSVHPIVKEFFQKFETYRREIPEKQKENAEQSILTLEQVLNQVPDFIGMGLENLGNIRKLLDEEIKKRASHPDILKYVAVQSVLSAYAHRDSFSESQQMRFDQLKQAFENLHQYIAKNSEPNEPLQQIKKRILINEFKLHCLSHNQLIALIKIYGIPEVKSFADVLIYLLLQDDFYNLKFVQSLTITFNHAGLEDFWTVTNANRQSSLMLAAQCARYDIFKYLLTVCKVPSAIIDDQGRHVLNYIIGHAFNAAKAKFALEILAKIEFPRKEIFLVKKLFSIVIDYMQTLSTDSIFYRLFESLYKFVEKNVLHETGMGQLLLEDNAINLLAVILKKPNDMAWALLKYFIIKGSPIDPNILSALILEKKMNLCMELLAWFGEKYQKEILNRPSMNNQTVLMLATQLQFIEIIPELLKRGADPLQGFEFAARNEHSSSDMLMPVVTAIPSDTSFKVPTITTSTIATNQAKEDLHRSKPVSPMKLAIKQGYSQIVAEFLPYVKLTKNHYELWVTAIDNHRKEIFKTLWLALPESERVMLLNQPSKRQLIIAQHLLQAGWTDILSWLQEPMTLMDKARSKGQVDGDQLFALLEKPSGKSNDGALHVAVASKNPETVRWLVTQRPNLNFWPTTTQEMPLVLAKKEMALAEVRVDLKTGALNYFCNRVILYVESTISAEKHALYALKHWTDRFRYCLPTLHAERKKIIYATAAIIDEMIEGLARSIIQLIETTARTSKLKILEANYHKGSFAEYDNLLCEVIRKYFTSKILRKPAVMPTTEAEYQLQFSRLDLKNYKKQAFTSAFKEALHYLFYVNLAMTKEREKGGVQLADGVFHSADDIFGVAAPIMTAAGSTVGFGMQSGALFSVAKVISLAIKEYDKKTNRQRAQNIVNAFQAPQASSININLLEQLAEIFYFRFQDQIQEMTVSISSARKLILVDGDGVVCFAQAIVQRIAMHIMGSEDEYVNESNIKFVRAVSLAAKNTKNTLISWFGDPQTIQPRTPVPCIQRCLMASWKQQLIGLNIEILLDHESNGSTTWNVGHILAHTGVAVVDKDCSILNYYHHEDPNCFRREIGYCYTVDVGEPESRPNFILQTPLITDADEEIPIAGYLQSSSAQTGQTQSRAVEQGDNCTIS